MTMLKKLIISIAVCSLFYGCEKSSIPPGERLWYTQPAAHWKDALPLGNGRLGAMVFGDPDVERLQLNEESLWAGCQQDPYPENVKMHFARFQELNLQRKFDEAMHYAMQHLAAHPTSFRSYQPLGNLYLEFGHETVRNYKRTLDLETGIVTIEYSIDGNRFKREILISQKYDAVYFNFSSLDDIKTDCRIRFEREKDVQIKTDEGQILHVDGQIFDDPEEYDDNPGGSGQGGYHMKFDAHAGVHPGDGQLDIRHNELVVSGSTGFTVVLTAATDYNLERLNFDRRIDPQARSGKQLHTAMSADYAQVKNEHIADHSSVYNRVELNLTDMQTDTVPTDQRLKQLYTSGNDNYLTQVLFQYGRYLLMGASAGNAVLPANLQGIWNEEMWAPWESDYHLNINLQMNYWPADVCNLSESMTPLSNYMVLLAQRGQMTAKKFIDSKGWVAFHATNPFGRVTPSGSTVRSQIANGYCFPLAGAWMSITLWRHFEFTQDIDYLRETAYPVLRGAALFILDFLKKDENGMLVTAPSYSPENTYIDPETGKEMRNTVASAIDIQIIRDVFDAVSKSEKILSLYDLSDRISEARSKLPEMQIGANGTLQEWIEDYEEAEEGHRHISHLYALHPSNQITAATPEWFVAAEKTLERRLAQGGGQTGWSRAWVVNFYARLFNGDKALVHINELLKGQVSNNLFDIHPPDMFQIDGNYGVTAGIAEMLLQSHEPGTIRLLPALPGIWQTGYVKGLKARGNIVVDIQWENGRLHTALLKALQAGQFKVMYGDSVTQIELEKGERHELEF
jgi:alpha-L-fucosidase 2